MELVVKLAVMVAFLALGLGARHVGMLDEQRRDRLNAVAFYGILPALIFTSTYDRPLGRLFSVELVVGLWLTYAGTVAIAWVLHRRTEPRGTRSVAIMQSYHTNFGYLGLPLVALTLGSAAAGQASVVLGVGALTQVPLTIMVLTGLNDADASAWSELRTVVTNPIILSLVVGLVVAATAVSAPSDAVRPLSLVAELALPVALVLVGSSLELQAPSVDRRTLAGVVGLKVVCMPVLAFLAFTALGAPPLTRNAGVVMFGAPAAVSTFVFATELGGNAEFASVGVFTTTAVSMVTLGAVLTLLV